MTPLSDDAWKVLRTLSSRAMDGYTLRAKTGLGIDALKVALEELFKQSLISVKGDLTSEDVGVSYISVPPSAKPQVTYLLRVTQAS